MKCSCSYLESSNTFQRGLLCNQAGKNRLLGGWQLCRGRWFRRCLDRGPNISRECKPGLEDTRRWPDTRDGSLEVGRSSPSGSCRQLEVLQVRRLSRVRKGLGNKTELAVRVQSQQLKYILDKIGENKRKEKKRNENNKLFVCNKICIFTAFQIFYLNNLS